MTIDEAMMKAGGFGRYQCFTLLFLIMSMNGPGLVVYGVAYYELQPPYKCYYTTTGMSENPAMTFFEHP